MRIEQNGPEICAVASGGGFVLLRVPVRMVGEIENIPTAFRYMIGGFVGRETKWPAGQGREAVLKFRVPFELFRDRERFTVEVLRTDERGVSETLWTSRREVRWAKETPALQPIPEPVPEALAE